jgi:membrane protein implicated in regulation of membrane protease activity
VSVGPYTDRMMSLPVLWWIAAGVLVAAELATGTFYLLMLALGAAAAALAAHAGAGFNAQLLVAALVGGGAVVAWHLYKRRLQPVIPLVAANRDVNIDIGEEIDVAEWSADGNGSALYRGARWHVRHEGASAPLPGRHVIRRVEGNRLHVEPLN